MLAIKGIYQDGNVTLIDKPPVLEASEVLVIFPDKTKMVVKIGGLFKGYEINEEEIEKELKALNQHSTIHLVEEAGDEQ